MPSQCSQELLVQISPNLEFPNQIPANSIEFQTIELL
jgi:hypothetical protein